MQQHLVVWGDIGTDHKALIAIDFNADTHMVTFRAFPEEIVDNDLQQELFKWKNGGEFKFTDDLPTWEVSADQDDLLPEDIKLHKPEMLIHAKRQWNKSLLYTDNFKLLGEKLHLIELEMEGIAEFNQEIWNRTKSLWDEISQKRKANELAWTQGDELKLRINEVFDGLKALRRLNREKNFEESNAIMKAFSKQIHDCEEKLVYPKEWNNIFKELKEIQGVMKEAPLLHKHRRSLYDMMNKVFGALREYRKTNQVQHIDGRIDGLKRVLRSLHQSIDRDEQSYKNQFEKMKHYTRGKMSDEDIAAQLTGVNAKVKAKEKKIASIEKTLASLEKKKEKMMAEPAEAPRKSRRKSRSKSKDRSKDKDKKTAEKKKPEEKADANAKSNTEGNGGETLADAEKPSEKTKADAKKNAEEDSAETEEVLSQAEDDRKTEHEAEGGPDANSNPAVADAENLEEDGNQNPEDSNVS